MSVEDQDLPALERYPLHHRLPAPSFRIERRLRSTFSVIGPKTAPFTTRAPASPRPPLPRSLGTPHRATLPGDGPLLRRRLHHLPEESGVDPGPTGETATPPGKAHLLRRSTGKRGERSPPLSLPDTSRLQAPQVPPTQGRDRRRIHAQTQAQLGSAHRTDVARGPGNLPTVRDEDGSPGRHLLAGPRRRDRKNPPREKRVGSPLETAPEDPRPAPIDFGISGPR